jgi:hypothetical protein
MAPQDPIESSDASLAVLSCFCEKKCSKQFEV